MSTFPPPGFMPTESAVEGITLYMPAPQQTEEAAVVEFKCPQCQATTAYSVADGGLTCAHCGYHEPPAREIVGKGAEEFEFTVETMAAAAHGWGATREVLHCQQCNAAITLPQGHLTHTCPFCGSNRVVQQAAPQDNLRPRFLLPFAIEADDCTAAAREWLGSSWMTPKALQELASVTPFNGVYIPCWTFDATTSASWKAEVGHTKTTRHYDSSSKTWKTRTTTVWRWESGHVTKDFDDLIVPGTRRLSQVLLDRVRASYNTRSLVPYKASYLAGLMALGYDIFLETAWEKGRAQMRELTRRACRAQASTNKIRNFSMKLDFSQESWRYILAPLYISSYQYEGQRYQVMVNGQTGTVVGQRPVSWPKVWLACAAMLLPGLILLIIALASGDPRGLIVLVILALVVGGAGVFKTAQKAQRMDDV